MYKFTKKILRAVYLAVALCTSCFVFAEAPPMVSKPNVESSISSQFAPLFDAITEELSQNQARYIANPSAYAEFINLRVKSLWDVSSTTSALVGKTAFVALKPAQQLDLIEAVDRTLMRYAFEGLENYTAQIFDVVDVAVNAESTLGWVQVRMQSPVLMDLNLDLLIKRNDAGVWKGVDVRFKGITYVSIKKHEFRKIMEQQGIKALIDSLKTKNSEYFHVICAQAPATLKGNAPC
jgi:ABC-type transporter MlaC component